MSIGNRFEQTVDPGFRPAIDPRAAQRQFNMSLGLVTVLFVAVVGLALLGVTPLSGTAAGTSTARASVEAPQLVHVRHAALPMAGG